MENTAFFPLGQDQAFKLRSKISGSSVPRRCRSYRSIAVKSSMWRSRFAWQQHRCASGARSARAAGTSTACIGCISSPRWNRSFSAKPARKPRNSFYKKSRPMPASAAARSSNCLTVSLPSVPEICRRKRTSNMTSRRGCQAAGLMGRHSSSNLLDFQARRSNIRYRDAEGKCHLPEQYGCGFAANSYPAAGEPPAGR